MLFFTQMRRRGSSIRSGFAGFFYANASSRIFDPLGICWVLLRKSRAEYILRWVPAGTHTWSKFVKPSELARGLRSGGVRVTDLRGMTYSPLTGEWSLSRDLAVNYLAFAVKDREEAA